MKGEWTTTISKKCESKYGVVWYEKEEGDWYSELTISKTIFCGFKTKKDAQLFLESAYKLEEQYQKTKLNHHTKLYKLVTKLELNKGRDIGYYENR